MKLTTVILGLLILQANSLAQGEGELSGRVVDSDGRGIDGLTVTYKRLQRQFMDSSGRIRLLGPSINESVVTAKGGAFSIKGPAGDYLICALPIRQPQIGSCEWPVSPGESRIEAGRVSPLSDLVIRTGTRVVLAFADSAGKLRNSRKFHVGVMSSTGYYQRAHLDTALSKQGVPVYVAVIPASTIAKIFVATDVTLSYKDGSLVATGRPDFRIETGRPGSDSVVEINVQ